MTSKENQASTDFSALALSPATLANLQQLGYTTMTPIQAASLPPALLGKDLIAQASRAKANAAVLPLPVLAWAIRSLPSNAGGRLAAWMGVICV